MVKGQGLSVDCLLTCLLKVDKHFDVQVTCLKVKVKLLVLSVAVICFCRKNVVSLPEFKITDFY